MRHLLFRLYTPLCSWGDIAPGTHRPSMAMPTRSALLGLVASAMGLQRDDDAAHERLGATLRFAVRTESLGALLTDYHTVQTPSREGKTRWRTRREELASSKNLNTILSDRDHFQDASYTVAVWTEPAAIFTLEELREKLDRPRYPLYLGRRACPPSMPLGAHIVEAATLREAFDAASFPPEDRVVLASLQRATEGRERAVNLRVETDLHPTSGYADMIHQTHRDDPASRARRSFRDRLVHTAWHVPTEGR